MLESPELKLLQEAADWRHQAVSAPVSLLSPEQLAYRNKFWASVNDFTEKHGAEFDRVFGPA